MFAGFDKIVEERIKKAQMTGAFDHLEGAGLPLNLENDRHIPEGLRMAHKILKNADCLPPEIELKKKIEQTETLLSGMTDAAEKYRTLKKLNVMIMKMNTMRGVAAEREMPQRYLPAVVDRIGNRHKAG